MFGQLNEIAQTYLSFRVGAFSFGPMSTSVLILALATAIASAFSLWRLSRLEDRQERLDVLHRAAIERSGNGRPQRPHWYDWLGTLVARSPLVGTAEQQRLLKLLAAGGVKGHGRLATFVGSKACGALALAVLLWLLLEWREVFAGQTTVRLAVLVFAVMLGWRLPDLVLSRLAARRKMYLEMGLPDALDLLVICAESGLSLDQAIEEVSRDLRPSNPTVAAEFATTAAEMRVLADRGEALENLVRRTGLASLRSITATLSQAIRFGTPLAESMRIIAAEMRSERLARLEERAARLPVLLAIPLMLFIMPSLLIVILTPVALRIFDFMSQFSVPSQ